MAHVSTPLVERYLRSAVGRSTETAALAAVAQLVLATATEAERIVAEDGPTASAIVARDEARELADQAVTLLESAAVRWKAAEDNDDARVAERLERIRRTAADLAAASAAPAPRQRRARTADTTQ